MVTTVEHVHQMGKDDCAVTTTTDLGPTFADGQHSRNSSVAEPMLTIHETDEVDDNNPRDLDENENTGILNRGPASTSLVRKVTNYLKSQTGSSSSHQPRRSRFQSLHKPLSGKYATVEDSDEVDRVSVDITSLAGLGFELRAVTSKTTQPLTQQDTIYQSPISAGGTPKPDFQSFVARTRGIGAGLDKPLRLERNASIESHSSQQDLSPLDRARTVRQIGRQVAKEKNTIVAFTETVDLSVLEGHEMINRRRTDQSFSTMPAVRAASVEVSPQSYFFPIETDIPNWKPFSMSTFFVGFLIMAALTLAGVQEYLYQKSSRLEKQHDGLLAFDEVSKVPTGSFFVWKYLPTMVTIVYAVLFSIMDFDIRRLEPYYRLSQPEGSTAAASLNLDHLTMFQYFVPFKAMRLGQWTVALSTIGNIIASTVTPALQNPSVDFSSNDKFCGPDLHPPECSEGQHAYFVRIAPVWSRLLSGSYVVIAAIALFLLFQLRRKSGLLSDPRGIAGIASMATKSHILRDFGGLDLATRAQIHKRLAHRRFVLFQSSIWQGEWTQASEPIQESEKRLQTPHPPMLRLSAGIPFITCMVLCLAAVPLISFTKANIIPNQAPWLPIFVATVLKLAWTTFEADVRLMEPFYQLSKGNARPENSITLDYQATVYGFLPFVAALKGHWLVATVGLCSVALDILSVTVGSFSVSAQTFMDKTNLTMDISNGDETTISFYVSAILSMVILVFVITTTCIVYARRRHPFLPREPSTIAAILAFIYASNMLDDFIGTERYSSKKMERILKTKNKRYGLGWFKGRDGNMHCAIDEEPMRSVYVHGKPYNQALAGPSHDVYYNV